MAGTIETEIDLLGRKKSGVDTWGNNSTALYDDYGRVTQRTGLLGTETFVYDSFGRMTSYALDGVALATVGYDTYGRVDTVVYPGAKDDIGSTLQMTQTKHDSLGRVDGATYQASDGKVYDETVVRSQLNKITNVTQTYNSTTLLSGYSYDRAGHLVSATIGNSKFDYGYDAPSGVTCGASGYNLNAHKNSNRTSYSVTNVATGSIVNSDKFCYDFADRLAYSTDNNIGTPTYDDHGNTKSFTGNGAELSFDYDANDYNIAVRQGTKRTEYTRTSEGVILRKKEYEANALVASYRYAAEGAILQVCSLTDDNSCSTIDKYISLPGNILLTRSPSNTDVTKRTVYSLKNYHGDTTLTFTEKGVATGSMLAYGPFGESLLGDPINSAINATDSSMGWAANPTRKSDSRYTTTFIQMGARVYIPTLGRFLQVDPIEGGTLNDYVYAQDPVNGQDYSGKFAFLLLFIPTITISLESAMAAAAGAIAGTLAFKAIQNAISQINARSGAGSQNKRKNQGYRPTTKPGLTAINKPTVQQIASDPNGAGTRAVATVVNALQLGAKPMSGDMPLFAPKGEPSKMNKPLGDGAYSGMSKYSYSYFDPYTLQTVEIHYNIDEAAKEYSDLKIVSIK